MEIPLPQSIHEEAEMPIAKPNYDFEKMIEEAMR
tara:strand:- start:1738 stop:1839 length:102 start_codon:yes stop_codon:yes gene_type:complete